MGVDFDADAVAEAARNITANDDEPEGRNRKERRWFGKKKK
jgi:ribosomal protein L11 methylase PrmA